MKSVTRVKKTRAKLWECDSRKVSTSFQFSAPLTSIWVFSPILFFNRVMDFAKWRDCSLSRKGLRIWKTGQHTSLRVYGSTFEITRQQLRIPGEKSFFQFCRDNSLFALFHLQLPAQKIIYYIHPVKQSCSVQRSLLRRILCFYVSIMFYQHLDDV